MRKIRVWSNPYYALDHLGRPAGIVAMEPPENNRRRMFIGAAIDAAKTKITQTIETVHGPVTRQNTEYVFHDSAVELPRKKGYMAALKSGALLPADEATAAYAGVEFLPLLRARQLAMARAVSSWVARYGSPPPFAADMGKRSEES